MAINLFEGFKKISREMFGDSKGIISLGHVLTAVFGVAAVVWISHILIVTHALPSLDGITTFVLAPYGTNKLTNTVQAFSQNPVTTSAPPVVPNIPAVPGR